MGGLNTYGYVENNPLWWTDLYGLTIDQIRDMLDFAKLSQTDLDVPNSINIAYWFNCRGCGITNPLTKNITISSYYFSELDCRDLKGLLELIIHESIHRTRPRSDMLLRPFNHPDIYAEAAIRVNEQSILNFLKERCECR